MPHRRHTTDGKSGVCPHEIGIRFADFLAEQCPHFFGVHPIAPADEHQHGSVGFARFENQRFDNLPHIAADGFRRRDRRVGQFGQFHHLMGITFFG